MGFFANILARLTSDERSPGRGRVPYAGRTFAGVTITPDNAVTVAAVWACLRFLSQSVAVLPWHVMKDGSKGAEIQKKHTVDWLLNKRPSPEWSAFQFKETLLHWALRWGNGYAEIEPDQLDRPFALWPIHPDRVTVCRAIEDELSSAGDLIKQGELYYEINNGGDVKTTLAAKRMYHLRGFGEGPVGVNVLNYAAQSIGWARAAQIFGATFFGNGMNPSGVVINKKPLKAAGLRLQKAEFDQLHKGPNKSNGTVFLDNDADYKRISLNAQETQLIDVHFFLVEEICRWFGVPPHKVMHLLRATFSNIESQAIEVVVDSVSPWVKRFEDEADYKLFGQNRSLLYTKMNMNALMRGDMTARAAWYTAMRNIGAYSVNKVLELEDENTIGPDGEKHTMQSGFTTLEKVGEDPPAPPPPAAPPADDIPAEADSAAANEAAERVRAMLETV